MTFFQDSLQLNDLNAKMMLLSQKINAKNGSTCALTKRDALVQIKKGKSL